MTNQLLDINAVADRLACDPRTVHRLAKSGAMPFGKKLGKSLRRWSADEIDSWIAGGCKPVGGQLAGGEK